MKKVSLTLMFIWIVALLGCGPNYKIVGGNAAHFKQRALIKAKKAEEKNEKQRNQFTKQ